MCEPVMRAGVCACVYGTRVRDPGSARRTVCVRAGFFVCRQSPNEQSLHAPGPDRRGERVRFCMYIVAVQYVLRHRLRGFGLRSAALLVPLPGRRCACTAPAVHKKND
eukprot:4337449-Prymnesium_polylepis.1